MVQLALRGLANPRFLAPPVRYLRISYHVYPPVLFGHA